LCSSPRGDLLPRSSADEIASARAGAGGTRDRRPVSPQGARGLHSELARPHSAPRSASARWRARTAPQGRFRGSGSLRTGRKAAAGPRLLRRPRADLVRARTSVSRTSSGSAGRSLTPGALQSWVESRPSLAETPKRARVSSTSSRSGEKKPTLPMQSGKVHARSSKSTPPLFPERCRRHRISSSYTSRRCVDSVGARHRPTDRLR
jgi:hypothetical protein